LIEAIHKMKQEKIREKQLADQREARRQKNLVKKQKRIDKKLEQLGIVKVDDKKDADKAAKKDEVEKKDQGKKEPAKKAQGGKDQSSKGKKDEPKKVEPKKPEPKKPE